MNKRKHNEEITVKTAKGEEFKFGGISETFTRKLFEWEERKGIAPESSTIALLNNSGQQQDAGGGGGGSRDSPNNTLKRCHSEGSIPDSSTNNNGGSSMPKAAGSEGDITRNNSASVLSEVMDRVDFLAAAASSSDSPKKSDLSNSPDTEKG